MEAARLLQVRLPPKLSGRWSGCLNSSGHGTAKETQLRSMMLSSSAPQVEGTGNIAIDALLPRSVRSRRNLNCGFEFGSAPGARAAVFCVRTFLAKHNLH